MFRVGSAVCSNFGFFAKSLTSGFTKSAFAEHGGSSFQNPTISLPRIRIISWCSSTQQKRGTNPFRYNSLHRTRRLSNMASTKEYRLLCLENPLLGEFKLCCLQLSGQRHITPFAPKHTLP
jgi:hypothetical protein